MNTVTATGTLVDRFELARSPKGVDHVRFTIDVAKRTKSKDGKWTTRVARFEVVATHQLARNLAASGLQAGDRLIVAGQVQQGQRRTRTGQPVEFVELAAVDVAPSLSYVVAEAQRPAGAKR